MKLRIGRVIEVFGSTKAEEETIRDSFALRNANYYKAKGSGRSTWGLSKRLFYAQRMGKKIICPYGSKELLLSLFPNAVVHTDKTVLPKADIKLETKIKPRSFQREAAEVSIDQTNGIFEVPTGGGKTILGIILIALHKTPTLVLVDSKEIFKQWVANVKTFFGEDAGQIQGKKFKVDGHNIVIAMVQTLSRRKEQIREYTKKFGMMLVDECQQIGPASLSSSFNYDDEVVYNNMGRVTQWFYAKKRYGLTDGANRSDGQCKCIYFALGPVIYSTKYDDMVEEQCIIKPTLVVRATEFEPSSNISVPSDQYNDLMTEIVYNEKRNQLIVSDLLNETGRSCLILANRKDFVRLIAGMLIEKNPRLNGTICVLTSATPDSLRAEYIDKARKGEINYLFATSLADKGLDIKCLDRLFQIYPGRFKGKKNQQLGRVVRFDDMKEGAVVYEYVDVRVGVLRSQFVTKAKEVYRHRCEIDYDNHLIRRLKIVPPKK